MEEYTKQLEYANEALQRKVEELESRLSWEEKTKDLRTLAAEYNKMDKEIYTVNKDKLVKSILSLDANSIIDMWKNGYRVSTEIKNTGYDDEILKGKRYSVTVVGPYAAGRISYDKNKFFGIQLAVRRSALHPFIREKCFLVVEHNRVCDFSGAIAESVHLIDTCNSKDIYNLIERINICKHMMNGKLLSQDCDIKLDTFKNPWTSIPGVNAS